MMAQTKPGGQTPFLAEQPHPENRQARCTTDGGAPLTAAVDVEASCCCGCFWKEELWLFVAAQNAAQEIHQYARKADGTFVFRKAFGCMPAPVRQMNAFWDETVAEIRLFVLADKGYILDAAGRAIAAFPVDCKSACALEMNGTLRVICDGDWYSLKDGGKLEFERELSVAAYHINANRYDKLYETGTTRPGEITGSAIQWKGKILYTCGARFERCGRENIDAFLCEGDEKGEIFSRRYLLIPNGGCVSLFTDGEENLFAAFVGCTSHSVVSGKPAVVRLERQESGFFRPCAGAVFETSPVDLLRPSDNGERDIRDTFVCAAEDGWYYLTGTTARENGTFWKNTDGINLWRSKDLKRWEFVKTVFDYRERQEGWQNQISDNCWAPEICKHDGTYWITYSLEPGCGLLKSVTGAPEGPYADMGRVVMRGIDSGFFVDDDGTMYLVWQNGWIAPFMPDARSFAKDPVLLIPEDGRQVGYEGAGIIKVAGKYVLYAAEWNGDMRIDGTYDMMYSVADSLYGPYSPRKVLVPHGGHGCLFYDHEDRLRFTMFGNDRTAPFSRKAAIGTVEIRMENGQLILRPQSEQT